jgi:hypothetical protein
MRIIRAKIICENCGQEWRYPFDPEQTIVPCRFCKHPLDTSKKIEVSWRNRRNRGRGKGNQRALTKFLGEKAENRGILGGADVVYDQHFYIEAKELKKIPSGFMKFWLQATHHCPNGRVPLVQIHELNKRHEDDFVFMRLEDFKSEITE